MNQLELEYAQKVAKETIVIRKYLIDYSCGTVDSKRTHHVWKDLLDESKLKEDVVVKKVHRAKNFITEEQIEKLMK